MFGNWKEKLAQKKAKSKAIAESRHWKKNALLHDCLQAMRGSCTVAPMDMHEAAITAANIALQEDIWTELPELIDIPEGFSETVYIVWNEATLPVLRAPWVLVDENLNDVRAVAYETFLVAESMDRILWFDGHGRIMLYSIT